MSVYYLPWWGLVVCLAASALAAYLFLERSRAGDSPWVLFPLTVILAPMLLALAMVVAITLSMLLSHAVVEDWRGTPPEKSEPPAAPSEHTRSRASPTTRADPLRRLGQLEHRCAGRAVRPRRDLGSESAPRPEGVAQRQQRDGHGRIDAGDWGRVLRQGLGQSLRAGRMRYPGHTPTANAGLGKSQRRPRS
jgi:hypothetical protein